MQYKALSIAGFDGSGGAGIQADLKTFAALGCYGTTVLTALPIQNTCGVKNCYELPLTAIEEQLEAIFTDIIPNSIKIGMLFNSSIVELVANYLTQYANTIPIVIDPVMIAKSGDTLLSPDAINTLKTKLLPIATIITPNLPEASTLTGMNARHANDMPAIAAKLLEFGSKAVLLKGGHLLNANACDFYLDNSGYSFWLNTKRINTTNTHGTGCTLSAAISAGLAQGMKLSEACKFAKDYLYHALISAKNNKVGKGHGPVHHFYYLTDAINNQLKNYLMSI